MLSGLLAVIILTLNLNISNFDLKKYDQRLICVSDYISYFNFGLSSQIADTLWIRFLQELDAFNQLTVADMHLCPDKTSSWHFHLMNVAIDLDSKFYEINLYAPLLISVTISDSKGASVLFDKAVANFPNDWRILYRASYQALLEEKNNEKAAGLLYRAGKQGAPYWVMSLAGGLYNESGNRKMAEQIYSELISESKDEAVAARLKLKLDNKLKNFHEKNSPPAEKEKK